MIDSKMPTIHLEQAEDLEAVRQVNQLAFETSAEAQLVDQLRSREKLIVSLVAKIGDQIVGHIAFSPVHITSTPALRGIGLGPMAVIPIMQRHGIGTALIHAGLNRCRELDYDFAVVLGHPTYYPRFGFIPANRFSVTCIWQVPEDAFMALELREHSLVGSSGLATYEPEFNEL
jgi:putative acetyltransferase